MIGEKLQSTTSSSEIETKHAIVSQYREIHATQSMAYIQTQDTVHTGECLDVTGHSLAGLHAKHSNDLMAYSSYAVANITGLFTST